MSFYSQGNGLARQANIGKLQPNNEELQCLDIMVQTENAVTLQEPTNQPIN